MNSRVKQAQKEGATVGDIAAGLAISVIKNALFKVIKICRDPHDVGTKVIVQGGIVPQRRGAARVRAANEVNVPCAPTSRATWGAYGAEQLARDRYHQEVHRTALNGRHRRHRACRYIDAAVAEAIEALAHAPHGALQGDAPLACSR